MGDGGGEGGHEDRREGRGRTAGNCRVQTGVRGNSPGFVSQDEPIEIHITLEPTGDAFAAYQRIVSAPPIRLAARRGQQGISDVVLEAAAWRGRDPPCSRDQERNGDLRTLVDARAAHHAERAAPKERPS